MRHDLNRILDEECAERERKMREGDELLAAAARGAPFWGVGKPTDAKVVGLADFVPDTSAKSLAMLAWFCSRGATGAGQWPGDPDDCAKQNKARDEFEAWWSRR